MDALLLTILLIVGVLVWLFWPGRKGAAPKEPWEGEGDVAELDLATEEVRDLGSSRTPEEGFEGDDWGPGTPRAP